MKPTRAMVPRLGVATILFTCVLARPVCAQVADAAATQIIVTEGPALVVQVAGEPLYLPVAAEGTVERIANASAKLYRATETGHFWTRVGKYWLTAPELEGTYDRRGRVPKALAALPAPEGAAAVKRSARPTVYVRTHRTVLVNVKGALVLERIGDAGGVHAVRSTDADLFFYGRDNHYYLLVGGRWYRAPRLTEAWSPVETLPPLFKEIPPEHERGYVLAAIPGTREHRAALAEVARVEMRRVAGERHLDVTYYGAPVFERIPGTRVAVGVNTQQDVFETGGLYYCCAAGVWYLAAGPTEPWSVCAVVPDALYAIPQSHPKHHVTSVIVHPAAEPGLVMVGTDPGYEGWGVVDGRVVHRTWDGPLPRGRVVNGRYFSANAWGASRAAHFGNWGRADWPARLERRRAALERAAPAETPASARSAPGDGQDARFNLEERRRRLTPSDENPAWYGSPEEMEKRRRGGRDWR